MTARIITILCLFVILSCQREIDPSILNQPPVTSTSQFTLNSSGANCSNAVVEGSYFKDVLVNNSNKLTVSVSVTKTGNWSASTNTVNGFSFSGNGQFSSTGIHTITLVATGKPSSEAVAEFTITAGSHTCKFSVSVATSTGNIPPSADAGPDKTISAPANNVIVGGTSVDPDGSIASYLWTRLSGPNTPTFTTASAATTGVNNLVQGIYSFALQVTDNLGATDRDTVIVTVNGAATAGSLGMQQMVFGGLVSDVMHYNPDNTISKVTSNHYPDRHMTYLNGKLKTIELWYTNGNGIGQYLGSTLQFTYDGNGNAIKLTEKDEATGISITAAEYEYNADGTIKSKKTTSGQFFGGGHQAYQYTSGNLTRIINNPLSPNPGDTVTITYDTRVNKFKDIAPQYYFLDIQTIMDQTYRSEMFYFSKNYPVSDGYPISVNVNPANQKPSEIRFEGELWYKFHYN